ncbi:hypothetical protein [Urbifossiella limnaea]|uniref:Uncharacterized protein n=1 Tax=Urbifossiella limnaea TaxID=2528023 RepID=A0A517XXL1_9BACT|nr:hypothetical protein [Urbifossiella limnaea]QDU22269.1 hypothetical protein ETAA1_42460 [Urbifossiella limnaea]
MTLLPGCRVAVAARFHLAADWPARLTLGAGTDEADGRFFPRGPWRAPTAQELALLVAADAPGRSLPLLGEPDPPPADAPDTPDTLGLFQLPDHLREAWWDLLDAAAGDGGGVRGFDGFAARVGEFLGFKRLGLPAAAGMEAIVTAAGERSIRRDPDTGRPSGLGPTVAAWAAWPPNAGRSPPRLWGVVNLGDEPSGVVLVNLSLPDLAAALASREPDAPPATVGELVARFLRAFPDYPPVRVALGSGEGCRVPPGGLVLDGDPTGKRDPDMLLLISDPRVGD